MAFKTFNKAKGKLNKKRKVKKGDALSCRFCRNKATEVDYKDLGTLSKLVTSQGKHLARKRSGVCAKHQRAVRRALKRARFVAFLPFCG